MAIRLNPEAADAQGLPVVTWEEDRNLFAPEGAGRARVACFIRPDAAGVLQFVSVGSVRHRSFEEERPWQRLHSFAESRAEQHYYSATDKVLLDVLSSRSKSGAGRLLTTDGALVMLANFKDERASIAMHLNCAEAAPVDMAKLHDRLHREFILRRDVLLRDRCGGDFEWPKDKPFVAYAPPARPAAPRWVVWLVDLSVIATLGLIAWGLYWLLVR